MDVCERLFQSCKWRMILLATCILPVWGTPSSAATIGRFDTDKDLLLLHYDCKTDVDDVQSAAAAGTILRDPRFANVRYHAVAGTYGVQGGRYVPANTLFELAFGKNWSDAHADPGRALETVTRLAGETVRNGGSVWVAEGGQSDFSAKVLRRLKAAFPEKDLHRFFHIVQHSDWNEEVTSPEALAYVRKQAAYHKIADGNAADNGTPCFKTPGSDGLQQIQDAELVRIWQLAVAICDKYNGSADRYLNEAIKAGGLDFSDTVEVCWILGFSHLPGPPEFFREFASGE